jgi:hypothetical protein
VSVSPAGKLRAIASLAEALADGWPTYEGTEAILGAPTIGGRGEGRGAGVSDPTAGVVATHVAYWACVDDITDALLKLRFVQQRMNAVRRHHTDLAQRIDEELRAARCSGAVDPLCTNLSVRDTGKHAGLCWRCIKRLQRSELLEDEGATG